MNKAMNPRGVCRKGTRCFNGFTMVELLVVVGIIMLLAGLVTPAVMRVFRSADIARAKAEVSALASAWTRYYAEYGKWPSGLPSAGVNYKEMTRNYVEILAGRNENDNPKKIQFMEFPEDAMTNVVSGLGDMVDPWGQKYRVRVSTTPYPLITRLNYVDKLNKVTTNDLPVRAAVWSVGPDGAASWGDNISSWHF